jgi:hypothetical protein
MFKRPALDYPAFPRFGVRNSLGTKREQVEDGLARLQQRNIDLNGLDI